MLTTYAEIQERASLWINRDDLNGFIPDYVVMAESRLNSILRVREMETSATITLTAGSGSLPTDYLAWRRVYANSDPITPLEAIDPDLAIQRYPETAATDPKYFYVSGSSIFTKPVCSNTLAMLYYQKIPSLIANKTGNWLTSRAPQIYLYAICLEAAPFIDDDARAVTWGTLLDKAIKELQESDNTARYARVAARVRGPTP
jgi:hypothetical protein